MKDHTSWAEMEELARSSIKDFIWTLSLMERDNRLTALEMLMLHRLKEEVEKKE